MLRRTASVRDMLRTDSQADQAPGNAAQPGVARQQAEEQRRLELLIRPQHTRDDAVLRRELEALGDTHRPFTPPLDLGQVFGRQLIVLQRTDQYVRGLR